ncbi:DNA-binding MarR family transcriptional regulator [Corticibacter populi]|nr:DNA-binding MarR family transcriptional regulator [Corticibacter populi]
MVSNYPGHGLFIPYLINRTATAINGQITTFLAQHGLTLTHWRVLAFLSKQDGLNIGELGRNTMTEQSTLSRSLQLLEKKGYVTRKSCRKDTRATSVYLTAEGSKAFGEILSYVLELEERYLQGVSEQEQATLRAALQKIIANSGQEG